MYPRWAWLLLAALVSLCFTSCDRRTRADMILTVGCQLATQQAAATGAGATDRPAFAAGGERQDSREELRRIYRGLAFSMPQLRAQSSRAATPEGHAAEELGRLTDGVLDQADELARAATGDATLEAQASEFRLRALATAAPALPQRYAAPLAAACQNVPGGSADDTRLAKASVQRFVARYLGAEPTSPTAGVALNVHALTYPECAANLGLYAATVDRFLQQGDVAEAAFVAREGLRLCQGMPGVEQLQKRLDGLYAAHRGAEGTPMDFAGPTRTGTNLRLASLRGRPVLVTFWASWCSGCREELPRIQRLCDRYASGLTCVGVSLDHDPRQLDAFLRAEGIVSPQLFPSNPSFARGPNPIATYYGVASIPVSFLVDADGIIAASGLRGEAAIEAAIRSRLPSSGHAPWSEQAAYDLSDSWR